MERVVARHMHAHNDQLRISSIEEAGGEPMHLMFSLDVPPEIIARFNDGISKMKGDYR